MHGQMISVIIRRTGVLGDALEPLSRMEVIIFLQSSGLVGFRGGMKTLSLWLQMLKCSHTYIYLLLKRNMLPPTATIKLI